MEGNYEILALLFALIMVAPNIISRIQEMVKENG